jgi:hypothetical protein
MATQLQLGETMQKKSKVVAIRLTESQFEALEWARLNSFTHETKTKTMSEFIGCLLRDDIDQSSINRAETFKREEASAKRKATREAKKATNDAQ